MGIFRPLIQKTVDVAAHYLWLQRTVSAVTLGASLVTTYHHVHAKPPVQPQAEPVAEAAAETPNAPAVVEAPHFSEKSFAGSRVPAAMTSSFAVPANVFMNRGGEVVSHSASADPERSSEPILFKSHTIQNNSSNYEAHASSVAGSAPGFSPASSSGTSNSNNSLSASASSSGPGSGGATGNVDSSGGAGSGGWNTTPYSSSSSSGGSGVNTSCSNCTSTSTTTSTFSPTITPPPWILHLTGSALSGGSCSPYIVNLTDGYANPMTVTSVTNLALTGAGMGRFFSDSSCLTPVDNTTAPVQFASGAGSATFYFKDATNETTTLQVSNSTLGWTSATLPVQAGCPTISLVQQYGGTNYYNYASTSSFVITAPGGNPGIAPVTTGDLLIVVVDTAVGLGTPSTSISMSVSDTNGNTWIPLTPQIPLDSTNFAVDPIQIFYAQNAIGGADTITVDGNGSSEYMDTFFAEYSGFPTTGDILEQQAGNAAAAAGSASAIAGTLTTTGACDLAVASFTDMNVGVFGSVGSPLQIENADIGYSSMYADSGTTLLPVGTIINASSPATGGDNTWAGTAAIFRAR